jgi:hypothetical protein
MLLSVGALQAADYSRLDEQHWNFTGDAVFMRRMECNDQPLVKNPHKKRECGDCSNYTVVSTKGLIQHFHFEPGFRASLVYNADVKNSFEAAYLWIRPWHGSKGAVEGNSLFFPFDDPTFAFDYFDASEAEAECHSRFWDAELNYWRHLSPRFTDFFSLSGLFGMRYFHVNESFKLTYFKPPDKSDYSVHTENDVFGFQTGLDLQMVPTSRLSWDLIAKVGVMANRAKQRNALHDYNNTVTLRKGNRQKWQCGLFADFLAQVGYQFKREFNLHIGYELIILSGLALAPEQVTYGSDMGASKVVYTHGHIFIQGGYIGATFSF